MSADPMQTLEDAYLLLKDDLLSTAYHLLGDHAGAEAPASSRLTVNPSKPGPVLKSGESRPASMAERFSVGDEVAGPSGSTTKAKAHLLAETRGVRMQEEAGGEGGYPSRPSRGGAEPWNREAYDHIPENGFRDPREDPLSTFSIDVDTASYANVRRFLREGRRPPAGAVRIEEMLNYFSYDYPEPAGDRPFSVTPEVAECPWRPGHRLVRIGVQGRRMLGEGVPPRNLVFLLDVSGSMRPANKLPLVKEAVRLLVNELNGQDHVAIVVYASASGMVLEPTSGSEKETILAALGRLGAGGSTNGAAGIRLAYDLSRRNYRAGAVNRVILATDGDFNVGVTSQSELVRLIEKEREGGVFLTVLGVGTGNLQDARMEKLADRGNGNYAYLDSVREARKVLVREASSTLVTIAKDVKIQVEFNPHRVGAYRLIGYENRVLAARDFHDDTKDAGEIGAGHSVTALYEIAPPEEKPKGPGVGPLRYQEPARPSAKAYGDEVLTVRLRYKRPDGVKSRLLSFPLEDPGTAGWVSASDDFRFAAAVASFGMLLRDSKEKGEATFSLVRELARGGLGSDPFGDRAEFLTLVDRAEQLR